MARMRGSKVEDAVDVWEAAAALMALAPTLPFRFCLTVERAVRCVMVTFVEHLADVEVLPQPLDVEADLPRQRAQAAADLPLLPPLSSAPRETR